MLDSLVCSERWHDGEAIRMSIDGDRVPSTFDMERRAPLTGMIARTIREGRQRLHQEGHLRSFLGEGDGMWGDL